MKNKIFTFLPAAVFIGFTFLFCILFFALPKNDFSEKEKRYLAKTPDFSIESLLSGELIKEIDGDSSSGTVGYVADHFPFRSFFVGVNSYSNLLVGNTANSDYYYCKDGFIITKPYKTTRLDTNINVINAFGKDVKVTLAVAPSAGDVLSDKLPANSLDYSDDRVYKVLEERLDGNINYCDIRTAIKDMYAQGEAPYYKTDHHWVTKAAYNAYCKLGESLGYTPAEESRFTKTDYSGFYGTTYSSSGYFLCSPDTLQVWNNPATDKGITVEIYEGETVSSYSSMYFEEHLSEADMYPVFLDGNHSLVKIKSENASGGKLLVIKDSYAHSLVPFLAENYSEIIMVDMRYYKESVSQLCKNEGIDQALVLYSISGFCTDTGLAFLE